MRINFKAYLKECEKAKYGVAAGSDFLLQFSCPDIEIYLCNCSEVEKQPKKAVCCIILSKGDGFF